MMKYIRSGLVALCVLAAGCAHSPYSTHRHAYSSYSSGYGHGVYRYHPSPSWSGGCGVCYSTLATLAGAAALAALIASGGHAHYAIGYGHPGWRFYYYR